MTEQNVDWKQLNREQRGLLLATNHDIKQTKAGYRVPSQSGNGSYMVKHEQTCTCPDFENREEKCKHMHAVEYTVTKTVEQDGLEIEKTVKITQDWTAYNQSQRNEHRLFMELLADLVQHIDYEEQTGRGRPAMPLPDMIYASALKVYSGFSLRRFESLMEVAEERGHISQTCSYATVCNYMNKDDLEPVLHDLIQQAAAPLTAVETDFAVDSSGFSTQRFGRYFDFKHGDERKYRKWIKAHLCCGVKTNIITAAELTDGKKGDSPEFKPLVKTTADQFNIEQVSADKAYSSRENHNVVDDLGGESYIPFTSQATGRRKGSSAWKQMYHKFHYEQEEFNEHYHKRSNVETTFHMLKTKFGDSVNAKNRQAQFTEVLLKLLCHNIVVVIHETHELGITAEFNT
jgi:transposase